MCALAAPGLHPPGPIFFSAASQSHINLRHGAMREMNVVTRSGLPDWSFRSEERVQRVVTPSPVVSFTLGCITRPVACRRRETGPQPTAALIRMGCVAAADRRKEGRKAPRGSISKQRYRVPVAIRSGAHAKFSGLVCGPRREAEAGGKRLRFNRLKLPFPL